MSNSGAAYLHPEIIVPTQLARLLSEAVTLMCQHVRKKGQEEGSSNSETQISVQN